MNTCINIEYNIYKTLTNKVFCKDEYEQLWNNKFPTVTAEVGNKSAAQRVVAGITIEKTCCLFLELLTGSYLKLNTNTISNQLISYIQMVYKIEGMMILNKGSCEVNLQINNIKFSPQFINFPKIRLTGIVGNTKNKIHGFVFSIIIIASLLPIT